MASRSTKTSWPPILLAAGLAVAAGVFVITDRPEPEATSQDSAQDFEPPKLNRVVLPADPLARGETTSTRPAGASQEHGGRLRAPSDHAVIAVAAGRPVPKVPSPATRVVVARNEGLNPADLEDSMSQILQEATNVAAPQVQRKMKALMQRGLTAADRTAAVDFALGSPPSGMRTTAFHALANDCLGAAHSGKGMTEDEFLRWKAAVLSDRADPVIIDYAIQHLGVEHEADRLRSEIEELVNEILSRGEGPGLPAALLLVRRALEEDRLALDERDIEPLAVELAERPEAGRVARTAALDLAAERQWYGAASPARAILKDPRAPVGLRLCAARALGQLGSPDDAETLDAALRIPGGARLSPAGQKARITLYTRAAAR